LNFGFSCLRSQERRGHISLFWPRVLLGYLLGNARLSSTLAGSGWVGCKTFVMVL
jgi:hypothetical protein